MGRYEVGDFLVQGYEGKIYNCKDLETGAHLAMKVSDDCRALAVEIMHLNKFEKIKNRNEGCAVDSHICPIIDYGMLVIKNYALQHGKPVD